MPLAIFEIEKEGLLQNKFNVADFDITKQNVEKAIFRECGLKAGEYDVYYIDSENDMIMAACEQDYSIAEQTF